MEGLQSVSWLENKFLRRKETGTGNAGLWAWPHLASDLGHCCSVRDSSPLWGERTVDTSEATVQLRVILGRQLPPAVCTGPSLSPVLVVLPSRQPLFWICFYYVSPFLMSGHHIVLFLLRLVVFSSPWHRAVWSLLGIACEAPLWFAAISFPCCIVSHCSASVDCIHPPSRRQACGRF